MQSREDEKKDQGAISRVLLIFVCTALSNSNGILLYTYQFEFHLNLDSLSFFAGPDDWESAKPGWQYQLFNFLLVFWICFLPLKPSSLCRQNSNAGRFAIDKFLNHVMRLMMMRRRRRGRRRRRLVIKMGMIGDETGDGVPRTCRHVVVWETRPTKTRGGVFCICLPQLCAVHFSSCITSCLAIDLKRVPSFVPGSGNYTRGTR